jgi:isopenicillin N synthase-like dioxygenase
VLPLVDVAPLLDRSDIAGVARQLDQACRRYGFVRIAGHGIPDDLRARLTALATESFALPDATKAEIEMARGGAAWRGWFPVGGELTSGIPDGKEGIYFGEELSPDQPGVVDGLPLHGANLFPAAPTGLGPAVVEWMTAMTSLGLTLLRALAIGLGLDEHWFDEHVTDVPAGVGPTTLFRIFHYPPQWGGDDDWGVREHTDYGLLTILAQDGTSGLEVHADELPGTAGWIDVPGDPDVFVVNLGDMLERMTRGLYRSTPHRVRNTSGVGRLSFPFFLDPSWGATVTPMPLPEFDGDASMGGRDRWGRERWDGADVHAWTGTYGEYLTAKVSRVFPELFARTAGQP